MLSQTPTLAFPHTPTHCHSAYMQTTLASHRTLHRRVLQIQFFTNTFTSNVFGSKGSRMMWSLWGISDHSFPCSSHSLLIVWTERVKCYFREPSLCYYWWSIRETSTHVKNYMVFSLPLLFCISVSHHLCTQLNQNFFFLVSLHVSSTQFYWPILSDRQKCVKQVIMVLPYSLPCLTARIKCSWPSIPDVWWMCCVVPGWWFTCKRKPPNPCNYNWKIVINTVLWAGRLPKTECRIKFITNYFKFRFYSNKKKKSQKKWLRAWWCKQCHTCQETDPRQWRRWARQSEGQNTQRGHLEHGGVQDRRAEAAGGELHPEGCPHFLRWRAAHEPNWQ